MTDYAEMIAKLATATEGDGGLDGEIALHLGWKVWRSKHGYWNIEGPEGQRHVMQDDRAPFDPQTGEKLPPATIPWSWGYSVDMPPYTTSVDAILALIEKRLPGWYPMSGKCRWRSGRPDAWVADLTPPSTSDLARTRDRERHIEVFGATMPLALCIALLTALQAQEAKT